MSYGYDMKIMHGQKKARSLLTLSLRKLIISSVI